MKEYFSHDYSARHDRKIAALIDKYKATGYGIFWATCEMMHEEDGELELDEITYSAISKNVNENKILLKNVISDCVEIFKLFVLIDGKLTSNRVKNNLNKRQSISDIRAKAGKAGANAKQKKSNAKQMTYIKGNENKESKVKESEVIPENFSLVNIYNKKYSELNGSFRDLTEKGFIEWKKFVDLIINKGYEEIFDCKFVNPQDFEKMDFPEKKWEETIKSILSSGIKKEHNLFFRIPQFMKYNGKETTTSENIKNKNMNALI